MTAKEFLEIKEVNDSDYMDSGMVNHIIEMIESYHQSKLKEFEGKIVIELSDEELSIVTEQDLKEMQDRAMQFDGFEGWVVKGRLAVIK